jgi:hypothetical protein
MKANHLLSADTVAAAGSTAPPVSSYDITLKRHLWHMVFPEASRSGHETLLPPGALDSGRMLKR